MSFSPKKRLDSSRELRRRRLFFVGLAIFVVADIALVAFALNPPVPERATIVTAPSVTPEPSAEPVESAEPTPPVTVVAAAAPTAPTGVFSLQTITIESIDVASMVG